MAQHLQEHQHLAQFLTTVLSVTWNVLHTFSIPSSNLINVSLSNTRTHSCAQHWILNVVHKAAFQQLLYSKGKFMWSLKCKHSYIFSKSHHCKYFNFFKKADQSQTKEAHTKLIDLSTICLNCPPILCPPHANSLKHTIVLYSSQL